MTSSSDDEVEVFTRKIKTLKGIAGDLNSMIEQQNNRIQGISPKVTSMLSRIQSMVMRVGKTDNRRINSWKNYFLATVFILLFVFIFLVVF